MYLKIIKIRLKSCVIEKENFTKLSRLNTFLFKHNLLEEFKVKHMGQA